MLWRLHKILYRIIQSVARAGIYLLDWREPELIIGAGSVKKLPEAIKQKNISSVLIETDKVLESLHLLDSLFAGLDGLRIKYIVFNGVNSNPSAMNIEDALKLYKENACEAIIAFGGGSPIDCAKVTAARAGRPRMPVKKMKGLLKILRKLPPLFAVPTTAGTGSEATIVAVVTDTATHEKYTIMDPRIRPVCAVLDPELTLGMPQTITASTGMDALAHAIEAYLGRNGTEKTDCCAKTAVEMVFHNMEKVYANGSEVEPRRQMLMASYYAGTAFTRAYVGYAHAIAHSLGGFYNTPHGLSVAVVLPYVLEFYGLSAHKKLAELADTAGVSNKGQSNSEKADAFITAVKELNIKLGIPGHFENIKEEDILLIAKQALHEANPLYPVPKIMSKAECEVVVRKIKG